MTHQLHFLQNRQPAQQPEGRFNALKEPQRIMSGSLILGACALLLAACAPTQRATVPPFYQNLGSASASVDATAAADMISSYRRNHGLGAVTVDPALVRIAAAEAAATARTDKPVSADAMKTRLVAQGVTTPAVNASAGYRTLAEAFSGWRESPAHNRTMLDKRATRMGIATAYAPGSKYKVYWVMVMAGP